ncbi:hypothetical protein ACVMIH_002343 [Bradyrhizobium sp. USDA 4503]
MLTETLVRDDIKNFLKRLSVAIELDQINVDALPPESFLIEYDDDMWRAWRHEHRVHIEKLLDTADMIPPVMLWQLTGVAIRHEPELVGTALLELFAEVAAGGCADLGSAEMFFGVLIRQMRGQRKRSSRRESAQASMLQWLPATDPLRIAEDPECGYELSQIQ